MKKIFTLIAVLAIACSSAFAGNHFIKVQAADMAENPWDTQFWIVLDEPWAAGDTWEVSMDVKADKEFLGKPTEWGSTGGIGTQTHTNPGGYIHWAAIGDVPFTTEWNTVKATGTVASESDGGYSIAFNLNDFEENNVYYFDNISVKVNGVEMVKNGDLEGEDLSSFVAKEYPSTETVPATVVEEGGDEPEQPVVSGKCITVAAEPMVEVAWETQFFVTWGEENALAAGDLFEYSLDLKADNASDNGGFQTHAAPGAYLHWAGAPAKFTTEWATTSFSTTIAEDSKEIGGYTIAVNLSLDGASNVYYFTNISVKVNGEEMMVNPDCTGEDLSQYLVKVAPDDQIIVTPAEYVVDGINSIVAAPAQDNRIFNVWGVQVDENYKGIVISNGKKYIQR